MAELQGSATSPVRTRGIGRVMAVLVACLLAAIVVSLCVGRYNKFADLLFRGRLAFLLDTT